MSSKVNWRLIAAFGAAFSAVAIVTFWLPQSSPPGSMDETEKVSDATFPLKLHATPRMIPAIRFIDKKDNSVELANFKGRMVLLNLWATWCAPCIQELPALDRLQQAMASTNFVVVALSLDRGGLAEVGPFWSRAGLRHLAIYMDPSMTAGQTLGVRGLPTTFLID
ncbi:uncharacterized protein METZ01_LOCUS454546, partial [marine metagenome]